MMEIESPFHSASIDEGQIMKDDVLVDDKAPRDKGRREDSDLMIRSEEMDKAFGKSVEASDDGSDVKLRGEDKRLSTRSSTSSKENYTPSGGGHNPSKKPLPTLLSSQIPPEETNVPRFMQRTTSWNLKKDYEKKKPKPQRKHKREWVSTAGPGNRDFEPTVPAVVRRDSAKSSPEPEQWDDSETPSDNSELPRYMQGTVAVMGKLRDKSVFESTRKTPQRRSPTSTRPKRKEVHIISIPFY